MRPRYKQHPFCSCFSLFYSLSLFLFLFYLIFSFSCLTLCSARRVVRAGEPNSRCYSLQCEFYIVHGHNRFISSPSYYTLPALPLHLPSRPPPHSHLKIANSTAAQINSAVFNIGVREVREVSGLNVVTKLSTRTDLSSLSSPVVTQFNGGQVIYPLLLLLLLFFGY